LGLPLPEVANSIDMSATLLSKLFQGHRISLDKLVKLAMAETFAMARAKAEHLGNLERAQGLQGTLAFLEKAYSKQYGDRKQIDINSGFFEEDSVDTWKVEIHHVDNKIKEKYDEEQRKKAENEANLDG